MAEARVRRGQGRRAENLGFLDTGAMLFGRYLLLIRRIRCKSHFQGFQTQFERGRERLERGKGAHLNITSLSASGEIFQLVPHRRNDDRLDGDQQILLVAVILQDRSEGVLDFGLDAPVGAQEPGHGRWSAKEQQSLVERVATQTERHTIAWFVRFRGHVAHPEGEIDVVMNLELLDRSQRPVVDQMAQGLKVVILENEVLVLRLVFDRRQEKLQ